MSPDAPLQGSVYCDRKFACCCSEADKIEDDFERKLAFIECDVDHVLCYMGQYASVAVDWVTRAMEDLTNWITLHPEIVEGTVAAIVLVGTVVLCIYCPPVGGGLLATEIAVVGATAAGH
ncbi:hypothetical protein AB0M20_14565 [Actinoplanes sp. NPDC051633]|uniref:hypothetical protein n=1 Tax=Actinoplanes sp. NPDC051633 TaxID=3155670 RepID=UPI0034380F3E